MFTKKTDDKDLMTEKPTVLVCTNIRTNIGIQKLNERLDVFIALIMMSTYQFPTLNRLEIRLFKKKITKDYIMS